MGCYCEVCSEFLAQQESWCNYCIIAVYEQLLYDCSTIQSLHDHSVVIIEVLGPTCIQYPAKVAHLGSESSHNIRLRDTAGKSACERLAPQACCEYAKRVAAEAVVGDGAGRTLAFTAQCVRIGDVCLVGLEGEIFCEYQLSLERYCSLRGL